MDDRVIKAALDAFEKDDFLTAKEKLQGQIKQAKNDYLKNKLGLEKNIDAPVEEPSGTEQEDVEVDFKEEDFDQVEEPVTVKKKAELKKPVKKKKGLL